MEENNEFYIQLSDEQMRAYRNAQLVSQIEIAGGIIGICHFLGEAEDGKPLWRIFLEGLGVSATCAAVARFVYPVRTRDILTFEKQNTNYNQPQMLGSTPQTPQSLGEPVTAIASASGSLFNMVSSLFGGKEETKQAQIMADSRVNQINAQVNLANAQNTGLVYNSLAINAKSQNDLALQRQRQTTQILAIGGLLAIGIYGIYAFSSAKKDTKNKKDK